MQAEYLGLISFEEALAHQYQVWRGVVEHGHCGKILGFESKPVVTLGVRGREEDLLISRAQLAHHQFQLLKIDRGGQATLHNPGQLVIFPVLPIAPARPKDWLCHLSKATRTLFEQHQTSVDWNDKNPGLYTARGKVAAFGVKFRRGVSTHGVAINVHNDLLPFQWIVPCGSHGAQVDRLPTNKALSEVFTDWVQAFEKTHDSEVTCELTSKSFAKSLSGSVRL